MKKLNKYLLLLTVVIFIPLFSQQIYASAKENIEVKMSYVRAVPPGQPNSAAFMQLINRSKNNYALVNAYSDISEVVELHEHTHKDGMMQMRRVNQIEITANTSTELKPGGLHIMLIKLKQQLKLDQTITITLEFSDGSKKIINAPVKNIIKMMAKHH